MRNEGVVGVGVKKEGANVILFIMPETFSTSCHRSVMAKRRERPEVSERRRNVRDPKREVEIAAIVPVFPCDITPEEQSAMSEKVVASNGWQIVGENTVRTMKLLLKEMTKGRGGPCESLVG